MMFKTYLPGKFCKEYVEIRRNSMQLTMFMAVVKGIKPLMDDWVKVEKYQEYKKMCRRYGLILKPSSIFSAIHENINTKNIAGYNMLTTTKTFGKPLSQPRYGDTIHVFIAKSKKNLEKGFRNGWYPLIIKNRVIEKPLIDAFKYGYDLGYPDCCVDFFQRKNNWVKYSFCYEIFKKSDSKHFKLLNNPFLKDDSYSYIYHMPCSYNCPETSNLANKVRMAIREEEPDFVHLIDEHLRLPILFFYERKAYAFKGKIKGNKLNYEAVYYIGQMREYNTYEKELKKGDSLVVQEQEVLILKKGQLLKKIICDNKKFAPEFPFLIQFV